MLYSCYVAYRLRYKVTTGIAPAEDTGNTLLDPRITVLNLIGINDCDPFMIVVCLHRRSFPTKQLQTPNHENND